MSQNIIMNRQAESAKKDKLQIIDWLVEHFPGAFFKKGSQVKPLQIGIFDEIIDFYERLDTPPFSKKALREALSYYSASPAYLNCQKPNVARVDLFGNEVDIVTEEQAKYAHQRYQQRYVEKKLKALSKKANS
ncbi:ProQ/FINO family protein [Legionella sp. PL877]|uniref:ProQ/FINO family protein n=2 Tax=unclassified Legionella TaxID=2622702 RepID=UPI00351C952B